MRDNYQREGADEYVNELLSHPYLARTVVENYTTPNIVRNKTILDYFSTVGDCIVLCIGRRRHWKTITVWDLAYEVHKRTGRPVYAIGIATELPWFAKHATSLAEVPSGAIVVWDESAVEASARGSMDGDQRSLPGELAVAGQNKLIIFFISQNTSLADKSITTLVDAIMVKPPSLTQMGTERGLIGKILRDWKELIPREKWQTLFLTSDLAPIVIERAIPDWWDRILSFSYAKIKTQKEAVEVASMQREGGKSWRKIAKLLRQRGWNRHPDTWEAWVTEANEGEDPKDRASSLPDALPGELALA